MAKTLESQIDSIISHAAAEVAQAVRANIAAEVTRMIGGGAAPAAGTTGKRGPGRPRKSGSVAKAPSATQPLKARAPHPRRSYTDADVERILGLIKEKPGLHSVEIQAQSGIGKKVVEKVLTKLRDDKIVKTKGKRSAMTYSL